MSDTAGPARLLAPTTVALLLALGITGFVATLLLSAYAPDWRGRGSAGGHALSDSVTGYSAIVRLAEATGRHPRVVRDVHHFDTEDLLVATPERGSVPIDPVLERRESLPTLFVLPKWSTSADAAHAGWVHVDSLDDRAEPSGVFAPTTRFSIIQRASGGRPLRVATPELAGLRLRAPRPLQAIRAPARSAAFGTLEPIVMDDRGDIVLGRFSDRPIYVLADPDLLDNRGMRDPRTAAAALALLDWMNSNQAQGIAFDVTLNGLAVGASPLKLLFEPPFLALTLTLAVALLLAVLGTAARFGSPRERPRALALGKAALVDNTAALVRQAGREARLGHRYVEVVREAAARAFAAPGRLRGASLDRYLDGLDRRARFTALADAVTAAEDATDMTRAARALHDWMGERE
ncbi:hypothetical protein KZ813_06325 [Sphingomonas sp. RHCKR7]|uniref:DUF4350 domain-containing protein n=1 Tax=Sphingomonas folli TaxID=2862497 RepID=UPI001CA5E3EB|nr:DUF4350 domain-containing protein [Sphingomonas folli]MBW6526452.1 hypothetical protein [Sphingomonas folli]